MNEIRTNLKLLLSHLSLIGVCILLIHIGLDVGYLYLAIQYLYYANVLLLLAILIVLIMLRVLHSATCLYLLINNPLYPDFLQRSLGKHVIPKEGIKTTLILSMFIALLLLVIINLYQVIFTSHLFPASLSGLLGSLTHEWFSLFIITYGLATFNRYQVLLSLFLKGRQINRAIINTGISEKNV